MTVAEYKQVDPAFQEDMFLIKVDRYFTKLLTSITLGQLERIDHFVGDEAYKVAESILEKAQNRNSRQIYEDLTVVSSRIYEISEDENKYSINVLLKARYRDYLIDQDTGEFVSGDPYSNVQKNYELTFQKNKTLKEQENNHVCPSCGHPLNIVLSGKCKYCGTIYNQEDYDFILTNMVIKEG